jgi:hypothetical protein
MHGAGRFKYESCVGASDNFSEPSPRNEILLSRWWTEIWKLHKNKVSRPQATPAVYVVWNL